MVKTEVSNGRRLNILAVDDEEGARASIKLVLKLAGHHAVLANDAQEALKLYDGASEPFDLIITDHAMPGLSGLELVHKLREKGYKREVLVLSANVDSAAEQKYRNLGVAGIMAKPFDINDLKEWTHCIPVCRERSASGEKPQCILGVTNICWLRFA